MNSNTASDCELAAFPFVDTPGFVSTDCEGYKVLKSNAPDQQIYSQITFEDMSHIEIKHFKVRVNFNYYQLDSIGFSLFTLLFSNSNSTYNFVIQSNSKWKGGRLKLILDGVEYLTQSFNAASGGSFLCGTLFERDHYGYFSQDIDHFTSTMDLEIMDSIDIVNGVPKLTGEWAIKNLEIYAYTCSVYCQECLTATTCLTCKPNMQLTSQGLCICNDDFYYDNTLKICQQCDSTCTSCVDSSTKCLSCKPGKFLRQNQCINACMSNEYSENSICYPCDSTCTTCTGPDPSQCSSCTTDPNNSSILFYLENGICKSQCSQSYYKVTSPNLCNKCYDLRPADPNPQRCLDCNDAGTDKCISCANNTYLQKVLITDPVGTCLSKCQNKYYARKSDNTCQECDPSCALCQDNPTNCQECEVGYYLKGNTCVVDCGDPYYKFNKECIKCDFKCKKCEYLASKEFCHLCNGYKRNDDGSCLNICQPHQYSDANDICHDCDASCKECFDQFNNSCTSCDNGKFLEDSICKGSCDHTNHWPNSANNNCDNCNFTCRSCNGGTNKMCQTCDNSSGNDRFLLVTGTDKECVLECPHFSMYHEKTPNDYTCKDCDPTCLACSKYDGTSCTACKCDPSLNQTDLWCEQNQNKAMRFFHNNKCLTQCTMELGVQLYGDRSTMTCKPSCKPGEYADINTKECTKCNSKCTLCTGPDPETECTACATGYYKATGVNGCFDFCHSDEFKDDLTHSCVFCNPSCQECTGPNSNQCLSCHPSDYQLNTVCYSKCPKPYWGKEVNGVLNCISSCYSGEYGDSYDSLRRCKPCNNQCTLCFGEQTNQCTQCKDQNFLLFTTCDRVCPIGYYANNTRRECVQCHATCEGCQGESDKDCTSCQTGRYLLNNICYAQCPKGTYAESSLRKCVTKCPNQDQYEDKSDNTCRQCHPNCQTCQGATLNECLTCANGFYKNDNSCLKTCPSGFYQYNPTWLCIQCHPECESCYGPDNNQCQSCRLPRIFYANQCLPQCPLGMFKHPTSNSCVTKCPKSYYANTSSAQCLPCHIFCESCFGSGNTKCDSCKIPYLYNKNICSESCLPGSYPDGKGSCSNCDISCKTCFGKTNESCITCNTGYFKQGETQCVSECEEGKVKDSLLQTCKVCPDTTYYESKECKKCHATCQICTGPLENQCVKCIGTRGKDDSQNPQYGICQCAPGYLEVNQTICQKGSGTSAERTGMTSQVGFYIGQATSGITSLAGQGNFMFFNLLDFCQFISYYQFVNVKYPLNVQELLNRLYISHFTSIMESKDQGSSSRLLSSTFQDYDDPQMKFKVNNRIYPLRKTFLPLILLNFCVWIFIGFLSLLGYFLRTSNNKRFMIEKIKSFTHYTLGIQIFIRTIMEQFLFLFLQAKVNKWDSLDIFTVILVSAYVLIGIGFIAKQSFRDFKLKVIDEKHMNLVSQEYLSYQRVKCLFEDKKDDLFSKNLALAQIIFKLIFTAIIVFIIDTPDAQALGIAVVKVVFFGLYLLVRPYKKLADNAVFLITELLMVGVALSVFMLIKYQTDNNRDNFAWAILILVVLAVLINLVVIVLQFLVLLLKKFCVAAIKRRRIIDESGIEREEEDLSSGVHYVTDNSNKSKSKIIPINDNQSQYQEQIQKDYIFNLNNSVVEPLNDNNNNNIINNQSIIHRQQQQNTIYLSEQDELFKKPPPQNINSNNNPTQQFRQLNSANCENMDEKEIRQSQQMQKPMIHNLGMLQNQLDQVIKIDNLQIYDENVMDQSRYQFINQQNQDDQIDYEQIQLEQNENKQGSHSSSASWHLERKKYSQSKQNLESDENEYEEDEDGQITMMKQRDKNGNSLRVISKKTKIKSRGASIPDLALQNQVGKFLEENEKKKEEEQLQKMHTTESRMIDWREERAIMSNDNQMMQNYRQGLGYYDFPQSYAQGVRNQQSIPNQLTNQANQYTPNQDQFKRNKSENKQKILPGVVRNDLITPQETPMDQQNFTPYPLQTNDSYVVPHFGDFQSNASIPIQQLQQQSRIQIQNQDQRKRKVSQDSVDNNQGKNQSFLLNLLKNQKKNKNNTEEKQNAIKGSNNKKQDVAMDEEIVFSKNDPSTFMNMQNNPINNNSRLMFEDNRDNMSIQQYNYNTYQAGNTLGDDSSQMHISSYNKSFINMTENESPERNTRINSIQQNKMAFYDNKERGRKVSQNVNDYNRSGSRSNDEKNYNNQNTQSVFMKLSHISQEASINNSQIRYQQQNKRLDNVVQKPITIQEELKSNQGQSVLIKNASLLSEFQKLQEQKAKQKQSQVSIQNSVIQPNFNLERGNTSQSQRKKKTKVKQVKAPHIVSFQRQQGEY